MSIQPTSLNRRKGERLATRLSFFAAGFSISCWAPLVPYAKQNVGADDAQLGLILLCLGIGSLISMPLTGILSARHGCKPMIVSSGVLLAVLLPFLPSIEDGLLLALTLFGFGAALGTLDVAMNIHAVDIDSDSERSLMSGFHGMYSAGGIAGAGLISLLLSLQLGTRTSAILCASVVLLATLLAWPRLRAAQGEPTPIAAPRGIVLLLSFLCAVCFLVEGAILDWGALLMIGKTLATAENAGMGFMVFSVAMTVGRLTGDRIVAAMGDLTVLIVGGGVTIIGLLVLVLSSASILALSGFLLIGLGASNIVPILFRMAGRQNVMPVPMAVAALTTTGYAGILIGPAFIGFVSQRIGLVSAFWILTVLMLVIPITARRVTRI